MENNSSYRQITQAIIGAAIEVHKALGPGLLESAYETCLAYELSLQGFQVETQKQLPLTYKAVKLDCGYRMDMMIDGKVVVEIKAIDQILPVHRAQLISYLKLSGCKVGLLINFNEMLLKHGIQRIVNEFDE